MPNYEFVCPKCKKAQMVMCNFRDLERLKRKPPTCKCGTKTEYKFPGPAGYVR